MLIVDAGPLYAAAARCDKHLENSVRLLSGAGRPLLVPALVLTEVSYLFSDRIGAEAELGWHGRLPTASSWSNPCWTPTGRGSLN